MNVTWLCRPLLPVPSHGEVLTGAAQSWLPVPRQGSFYWHFLEWSTTVPGQAVPYRTSRAEPCRAVPGRAVPSIRTGPTVSWLPSPYQEKLLIGAQHNGGVCQSLPPARQREAHTGVVRVPADPSQPCRAVPSLACRGVTCRTYLANEPCRTFLVGASPFQEEVLIRHAIRP